MGLSVARPATGVMDLVEIMNSHSAIACLDIFKNVIVKCRATAEQDGEKAGKHVRGPVQPRTTDKHKRRQTITTYCVRISPRR